MNRGKLSKELAAHLVRTSDESFIDVVLEIRPGEAPSFAANISRQDRIAASRQHFLDAVTPVERRIELLGGEVLDRAWLNGTVRARVPARTIAQLTDTDCVASVDLPAPLSRE